jgi:hypothetical protein
MERSFRTTLLMATLLTPAACFAQSYGPTPGGYGAGAGGGFSLERWDEDYSYLKDQTSRSVFLDPIKYIPLGSDGSSYLSFGGQARYRFDYFNNRTFGPGINDEDGFHLQRYLVNADAHLGQNFRAFVQLDSSFADGREGGPRYGDTDAFDLQQAFVDLKTSDDANPWAFLRLGRQELIYGAQRFISPDDWRNVRRSFDGAKLSVSVPGDTVELFVTRPVLIEREQFDNDDAGTVFSGIYNVTSLPTLIDGADSKVELYLLDLNQTRHSTAGVDADTYTLGGRFVTKLGAFDFDVEGDFQFGDDESQRIAAWSIAGEAGYTFRSTALTPRASFGFDAASGSPKPNGRFNQLFPPTYDYLGHVYLFGRTNLIDAHVGIDLHLTNTLTLYVAQHAFWRQNTNGALYDLSGALVRGDNGSDASYVGNEFDAVFTWQIDRHISAYLGWAHFFAGDFISQTGPSKDVDFLYASVTYTF